MAPKRTIRQRFWRALGFGRYHLSELPPDDPKMPGWALTRGAFHFDIADRLRLLCTGRLLIETRHSMSAEVDTMHSAMSFMIAVPGEKL